MKPRLLLDVDGPLCDFISPVLAVAGIHMLVDDFDFIKKLPEAPRQRVYGALQGASFWRGMPVVPRAHEGVRLLSEHYEVVFATSPWFTCWGWESARRDWLSRHFSAHWSSIVFANNKTLLAGDLMLDDKPGNLTSWLEYDQEHRRAYAFALPLNEGVSVPRLTWDDIIDTHKGVLP